MSQMLRAYSLGYEGISLDRYVELLKGHGVAAVVDVREHAWSYKKGFSKKPLTERLAVEGIGYVHLKSAGNPSKNRKSGLPPNEVIERYREHLSKDERCLGEVLDLIRHYSADGGVCLLCFERHPHECHRKVILDRIVENGEAMMTCHLGEVQA